MNSRYNVVFFLAALLFNSDFVDGFSIVSQSKPKIRTNSCLKLTPAQGSQLIAAWEASCTDIGEECIIDATDAAMMNAVPNTNNKLPWTRHLFSSRVSSIVRSMRNIREAVMDILPNFAHDRDSKDDKDVVLYPIVGFRFVKDENNRCRVLPTTLQSFCSLRNNAADEELYGWFGTACGLELHDDDEYCLPPNA